MTTPSRARLAPLAKESWSEEARDALRTGFPAAAEQFLSDAPDAPRAPNVLATLLHHPALAGRFLQFNRVLLETPALGARWRELAVLRVAWRAQSTYEWVQHARLAVAVGISTDEIGAIAGDWRDADWSPVEAALLAATDELLDGQRIADATWERLAEHLDERQLVELVFTVGTYTCLAMAFNSFAMQLDPGLEPPDGVPVP